MKCRVLDLPAKDALFNTALDQFLLEKGSEGQINLAFTTWRHSVLVGNSQSVALDVDVKECGERAISVMRRFSGGQAVYLDENYIVFSLAGHRSFFPTGTTFLDKLRQQMCQAMLIPLRRIGVPASFFEPDNLVIREPSRIRTIGNSGQVIKRDSVLVQASIRYDLPDSSLREMLAVLKINGKSLKKFFKPAKTALGWVREFANVDIGEIKKALFEEIARSYGCEGYYTDILEQAEIERIEELAAELSAKLPLVDKPTYRARGVCYFYLGGQCIVPEIAHFLPQVKPSTVADSTIA